MLLTKRMLSILMLIAALLFITTGCIGQPALDDNLKSQLSQYLSDRMVRHNIPGMAVAVLKNGAVIYQDERGWSNMDTEQELESSDMIHLHSLSKIFVSTALFQLIEDGKLALEDSIGRYLVDLPDTWRGVKIKHLLSHSCGWGDIAYVEASGEEAQKEIIYNQGFRFSPGERFWYNQTNYWLLNRIIKKITKKPLDRFIIDQQFAGVQGNAFIFENSEKVENPRINAYSTDGEGDMTINNMIVPDYMLGAAGVYLSIDQFVEWSKRLESRKYLREESMQKMWSPFTFENSDEFAHGWAIYRNGENRSVGFSGGGKTGYRHFIDEDLTVILLTNGYEYGFNVGDVIDGVASILEADLLSHNATAEQELFALFSSQESATIDMTALEKLEKKYHDAPLERILNSLGYEFLAKKQADLAIEIFELNTKRYPESWNVYDSLAEAYEFVDRANDALKLYRKSVELNPDNGHGAERITALSAMEKAAND